MWQTVTTSKTVLKHLEQHREPTKKFETSRMRNFVIFRLCNSTSHKSGARRKQTHSERRCFSTAAMNEVQIAEGMENENRMKSRLTCLRKSFSVP